MTIEEAQAVKAGDKVFDKEGKAYRFIRLTDHARPKIVCTDEQFTYNMARTSLFVELPQQSAL